MGTITIKEAEGGMPTKDEVQFVRGLDAQGNPVKISPSNLNVGKISGYNLFGNSGIIKTGTTVSGLEEKWCRIAKFKMPNFDDMSDVAFFVHSSFNDCYGILLIQSRGTSYSRPKFLIAYNIKLENFRLYCNETKTEVELYALGGGDYKVYNFDLLYASSRANAIGLKHIDLYYANTTPPSFTDYETPKILNLQSASPAMTLEEPVINDKLESANRKIADLEARIAKLEGK